MDVAIIDEMAVMPEKFCYGMIFPMLIMTRAALIILSTFQGGGNNIFARMNKLQLKDKTFLFTVIQLVNICPDCTRKSDIEHGHIHACIHMLPFMPKHHSKRQLEFITVLNTGRETTMARENLNLDVGTTNRVIPKAFADKFAATRDYEITKPKGFVYIGYDPHPGGPESMVGIHAATYDEGIHVIVSQDTFHSHNPADQIDAIMAMIRTICMFKVFASCVFVICPEANTIVHAKLLGEFVNSSACDDLRERLCMLHEVKSDPRRPGLCTTKEVNQCYQLRTLMQENRLRYWTGFFTTNKGVGEAGIKRIFRDQIDNYRYETAGSKKLSDVMTKDSKIVTTGKINGGHDDLLDSAEIACLAKFYFSMDSSKYNKYKMSDDY